MQKFIAKRALEDFLSTEDMGSWEPFRERKGLTPARPGDGRIKIRALLYHRRALADLDRNCDGPHGVHNVPHRVKLLGLLPCRSVDYQGPPLHNGLLASSFR